MGGGERNRMGKERRWESIKWGNRRSEKEIRKLRRGEGRERERIERERGELAARTREIEGKRR